MTDLIKIKNIHMKKVLMVLGVSLGVLIFASCSKKECVCVTTSSENGVITNSSTTSSSNSGIPGPVGNATDKETCNLGDYSSTYTSGGTTYEDKTECDLD